ncbi:hypothetical protein LguiA_011298 [Lonicera macranthoides]
MGLNSKPILESKQARLVWWIVLGPTSPFHIQTICESGVQTHFPTDSEKPCPVDAS